MYSLFTVIFEGVSFIAWHKENGIFALANAKDSKGTVWEMKVFFQFVRVEAADHQGIISKVHSTQRHALKGYSKVDIDELVLLF